MKVRELIIAMLEEPMDYEVILRDKDGNRLTDVTVSVQRPEGLGALFG